ncbi:MAG: dihydrodipicolinate synthase family protein [Bacteroidia bacterium]|nr:dihydrodipicolinate synthase family protein [Bacteroidia bacterium]
MKNHLLPKHALIAAPFTPMYPDGRIRPEMIPDMASFLAANGVKGAFIGGSTGEGPSLTMEERKTLFTAWGASCPSGFTTIAMVGGNCQADAQELARSARDSGIHALAILAPSYFPLHSVEYLVEYCAEIAAVVPDLPVYYYHIPGLTGVDFSMYRYLEIAETRFPSLVGIKYSHSHLMDFHRCTQFRDGKYTMLWGRDEELLAALSMGADGAVGSTYNYHMPVYRRLLDAFEKGDIHQARFFQEKSVNAIARMYEYGGIPAGKAIMQMIGRDCGTTRAPLRPLSEAETNALQEALVAIGFFEDCSG